MNQIGHEKMKSSIWKKLLYFILGLIIIFISVIVFSFVKISNQSEMLLDVSKNTIPNVLNISKFYENTKELKFLVNEIETTDNKIKRKIAYKKALAYIDEICESNIFKDKDYLRNLSHELSEFYELYRLQDSFVDKISSQKEILKDIFLKTYIAVEKNNLDLAYYRTIKNCKDILLYTNYKHFKNIDKNQIKINNTLRNLIQKTDVKEVKDLLNSIIILINKKENIFDYEHIYLKNKFVIKNESSLLKNIVASLLDSIKYYSIKYNNTLIEDIKISYDNLQIFSKVLMIILIISSFYFIFITFYFKEKVVKRLTALNMFIFKKRNEENNINSDLKDDEHDEISYIIHSFNHYSRAIEKLSFTDKLTELANKRYFDMRFKKELAIVQRNKINTSIMIIDIDHFKIYNDTYGHLEGDKCLKSVAKAMKSVLKRKTDFIARYGGEEFICILSNTKVDGAKKVAYDMMEKIKELNIPNENCPVKKYVTVSIGIKSFNEEECHLDKILIKQADEALYEAKENGRNQCLSFREINKAKFK